MTVEVVNVTGVGWLFALRFVLRFVVRYALRFTPHGDWSAGLRLGGAGLRGLAFFDISICTGNSL